MARTLHQARRIIPVSKKPTVPPPLPLCAIAGTAEDDIDAFVEELPSTDPDSPESYIRDLRKVLDESAPAPAVLPPLDEWLADVPTETLVLEPLPLSRRVFRPTRLQWAHPSLNPATPLEDLPALAPPRLSIWAWLWLALLCG